MSGNYTKLNKLKRVVHDQEVEWFLKTKVEVKRVFITFQELLKGIH